MGKKCKVKKQEWAEALKKINFKNRSSPVIAVNSILSGDGFFSLVLISKKYPGFFV
jgi:hypothetical protein